MKNTIVLIDGFNLYYGLLRGTPWKWLDLIAFSQALLGNDHHILAVKYFTSPVKTHPHDLRQSIGKRHIFMPWQRWDRSGRLSDSIPREMP